MCVCVGWGGENKHKWPGQPQSKFPFWRSILQKTNIHHQAEPPPPECLYTKDLYALCFIPMHQFSCSAGVAFFKRWRSTTAASIHKDFYESSLLRGFHTLVPAADCSQSFAIVLICFCRTSDFHSFCTQ